MDGLGTELSPYIIHTLNDLQDVALHPRAYYELGNDIDASPTATWDGGAGFVPIGNPNNKYDGKFRPISDISHTGTWTRYPDSGGYYDKVDEEIADDDSTYINCTSAGDIVFEVDIPNISDKYVGITNQILISAKNLSSSPKSILRLFLVIDGVKYYSSSITINSTSYSSYGRNWTQNPATGKSWLPDELSSISAIGIDCSTANLRVTQVYINSRAFEAFIGHLDGKNHIIRGLHINRPTEEYVGLFGSCQGECSISNIVVKDASIAGSISCGILAGEVTGESLTNIGVSGSLTVTNNSEYVGGMVGYCGASVNKCYAVVDIECGNGCSAIGGLLGSGGSTSVSYAVGTLTCGTSCGDGTDEGIGGLIGFLNGPTSDCYSIVDVSVGLSSNYVGGFAGYVNDTVNSSYAAGAFNPSDAEYAGGFCGYDNGIEEGAVLFWDIETSGTLIGDGAGYDIPVGKATEEMKTQSTYDLWDFESVWIISDIHNNGYPALIDLHCFPFKYESDTIAGPVELEDYAEIHSIDESILWDSSYPSAIPSITLPTVETGTVIVN